MTFNQLLETVLITNTPAPGSTRQNHSPWLFLDAAHTVFSVAKERVYLKPASTSDEKPAPDEVPNGLDLVLEELPKWVALKEVLDEIENEIYLNPQHGIPNFCWTNVDDGTNCVIIMCTDERTCKQLRDYLQHGSDVVMRQKLREYFKWKANFQKTKTELFEKKPANSTEDGSQILRLAKVRYLRRSTIENETSRWKTAK